MTHVLSSDKALAILAILKSLFHLLTFFAEISVGQLMNEQRYPKDGSGYASRTRRLGVALVSHYEHSLLVFINS